jgi:hypothetical protein
MPAKAEVAEPDKLVFQGLQKKKRCALCLQDFYVDELPGAISFRYVTSSHTRVSKLPSDCIVLNAGLLVWIRR